MQANERRTDVHGDYRQGNVLVGKMLVAMWGDKPQLMKFCSDWHELREAYKALKVGGWEAPGRVAQPPGAESMWVSTTRGINDGARGLGLEMMENVWLGMRTGVNLKHGKMVQFGRWTTMTTTLNVNF